MILMSWWKLAIAGNNGFTFNFINHYGIFVTNWVWKFLQFQINIGGSCCCWRRHSFFPTSKSHSVQSNRVSFFGIFFIKTTNWKMDIKQSRSIESTQRGYVHKNMDNSWLHNLLCTHTLRGKHLLRFPSDLIRSM